MRFYVVHDGTGSVIGCELTLGSAHALGRSTGDATHSITKIDCPVNVETIRRLLGNVGGYATESTTREYSSKVNRSN